MDRDSRLTVRRGGVTDRDSDLDGLRLPLPLLRGGLRDSDLDGLRLALPLLRGGVREIDLPQPAARLGDGERDLEYEEPVYTERDTDLVRLRPLGFSPPLLLRGGVRDMDLFRSKARGGVRERDLEYEEPVYDE